MVLISLCRLPGHRNLNTFLCFSPIDLALSVSSSDPVRVSLNIKSILWLRYLQMMVIII